MLVEQLLEKLHPDYNIIHVANSPGMCLHKNYDLSQLLTLCQAIEDLEIVLSALVKAPGILVTVLNRYHHDAHKC